MNFRIIKLASLFIPFSFALLFTGCEEEFDNVIDNSASDFQVTSVAPSDSIKFNFSDSLITIKINFNSSDNLQDVFCDVYSSANIKLNTQSINLFDNGKSENGDAAAGDGQFANKFPLSQFYPNGIYDIKYFVTDASNQIKEVAWGTFKFDNGQNNIAPIISNLILADSIKVGTDFVFSVLVTDANGYNDIDKVYFELYRPDGTVVKDGSGNWKFDLFDNGDLAGRGDQFAGDGIFSFKNSFLDDPSTQRGLWRFEFTAKDQGNKLSNVIIKSITVL